MKRTLLPLAVALVVVLTLGAAVSAATLQMLWWESGDKLTWMQSLVDRYEKENPGIKINLETVPWDEYWQKMPVLMAAGRAPDIMFMVSGNVQRYALMGGLADMSPYLTDEYIATLYEPHLEMVTYDGDKIAALPFTLTAPTVFYNKNAAAAAGINPPKTPEEAWTWAEFKEAAIKMKEAAGTPYGVHIVTRDFWRLPFLYQNGAAVLNEDRTASAINSPEAARALQFLQDLTKEGIASSPVDQMAGDMFIAGLIPMVVGAHWDIATYERSIEGFEYDATFMPREKQHAVALGGDFLAVYSQSKYPEEAVRFIQWVTSPEINSEYIINNYYLSPFKGADLKYPAQQETMELVAQQAALGSAKLTGDRAIPQWDVFLPVMMAEFDLVLMGEKTPEAALAVIEAKINEALAR